MLTSRFYRLLERADNEYSSEGPILSGPSHLKINNSIDGLGRNNNDSHPTDRRNKRRAEDFDSCHYGSKRSCLSLIDDDDCHYRSKRSCLSLIDDDDDDNDDDDDGS